MEQHCVVYKISIPKCPYFITYFNRRLGTWLTCRKFLYNSHIINIFFINTILFINTPDCFVMLFSFQLSVMHGLISTTVLLCTIVLLVFFSFSASIDRALITQEPIELETSRSHQKIVSSPHRIFFDQIS